MWMAFVACRTTKQKLWIYMVFEFGWADNKFWISNEKFNIENIGGYINNFLFY